MTIVIPIFNNQEYLFQCLESIVNQSLKAIEVICIDDGSTDSSPYIISQISQMDPRVRVITNERNLGAAESRNRGIKAATGRFIRFVDADDVLPLNSTEILYNRIVATRADAVRGSLASFRSPNYANLLSVICVPNRMKASLRAEKSLWVPWWHTSYLISTELIFSNNLNYPELRQAEDPVFLASVLISAQHVTLVPDIVYLYRKYRKTSGSGATTFTAVLDVLKHGTMVKAMFTAYHPDCWDRGYGPFLLKELRILLAVSQIDEVEREIVTSEAVKIFGPEVKLKSRFNLICRKIELLLTPLYARGVFSSRRSNYPPPF